MDFTYDLAYLQNSIKESQSALKSIVQPHLTDKSLGRIDEVFDFFGDATLLETAFKPDSPYREVMGKIVADINAAMETGDIWAEARGERAAELWTLRGYYQTKKKSYNNN